MTEACRLILPKRNQDGELVQSFVALFGARAGRKPAKNASPPQPCWYGLRGTRDTFCGWEGAKVLLPPWILDPGPNQSSKSIR